MTRTSVALLTDYGDSGPYAGVLRAVILSINPDAVVFDITHEITPQGVEEGAFVLAQALPYLPRDAVCVAVVDPGVGTERRPIALLTERATFVGPDNGLLSAALETRPGAEVGPGSTAAVALPAGCLAVELVNPEFFLHPISNTFHGRDIFAPVAAHLTLGRHLDDLGPALQTVQAYPAWRAPADPDGTLLGRVVVVDRFGNLISDVRASDLPAAQISVKIGDRSFSGLQRSFQDGPEFSVYVGSSGYLELARRNASAAVALGVGPGARILVRAET